MASNDNDIGNDNADYNNDSDRGRDSDDDDDDDDDDDEVPDLIVVDPTTLSTTDVDVDVDVDDGSDNNNNNNNDNSNVCNNDTNNSSTKPCPVTILSGFLGSGKTTLIQYILKSPDHGKRIAVIENEFGDGLDVESLIARDGIVDDTSNSNNNNNNNNTLQDLIELPNGCVCCTVKDALVETLELLIEKRNDLDYILIEASGMADPGPIASVFWLDLELESRLKLDGIVTIVDCRHILSQLQQTEEASRQIAYADRIVLNKIDLLVQSTQLPDNDINGNTNTNTTVEKVKQEIRKIHPTAPILQTSFSKIPNLDWILDANCFGGSSRINEIELELLNSLTTTSTGTGTSDENNNNNNIADDYACTDEFCCDHNHDHDHHNDHEDDHKDDHKHNDKHKHEHEQHNHKQHKYEHKHTSSISTVAFEIKGSVNLKKLNSWLADILWPNQDETDKVLTAMLHDTNNDNDINDNTNGPLTHQQQQQSKDKEVSPRDDDNDDEQKQKQNNVFLPHHNSSRTSNNPIKDNKSQQQIYRIKGIVSVRLLRKDVIDDDDYDINNDDTLLQVLEKGKADTTDDNDDDDYYLDPRRYIIQGVYDLWDIHPASNDLNWANTDNDNDKSNDSNKKEGEQQQQQQRVGKIVVIGKYLQKDILKEGFEACFY